MATDFDAIAEAIITQHLLAQDPEWIFESDFQGSPLSANLWAGIRSSCGERLYGLGISTAAHYEIITTTRVTSDELAFVRSLAPASHERTPVGALAALHELTNLAMDCMFALVVRRLRQLVTT